MGRAPSLSPAQLDVFVRLVGKGLDRTSAYAAALGPVASTLSRQSLKSRAWRVYNLEATREAVARGRGTREAGGAVEVIQIAPAALLDYMGEIISTLSDCAEAAERIGGTLAAAQARTALAAAVGRQTRLALPPPAPAPPQGGLDIDDMAVRLAPCRCSTS